MNKAVQRIDDRWPGTAAMAAPLRYVGALALLLAILGAPRLAAAGETAAGEHAHHHHVIPELRRSVVDYSVPDVKLVRDDGKTVALPDEVNDGRPVVLAFIYTACTTVCPLTSQTLSQLQSSLGAASARVHLMSISIDPEQDTPARLHAYARQFGAGPEWQHYTGTLEASRAAQVAFDVYRGNKMDHQPTLLVRSAPGAKWVRIDGFATAEQLLAELPVLHASN
jgi:protein SCO1/2